MKKKSASRARVILTLVAFASSLGFFAPAGHASFCRKFYDHLLNCEGPSGRQWATQGFCARAGSSNEAAKAALLRAANPDERKMVEADKDSLIENTVKSCAAASSPEAFAKTRDFACSQMSENCAGPNAPGRKYDKKTCDSGSDCMKNAADEQSKGRAQLGKRKQDYQSTISEMDKSLANALAQAAGYVDGLANASRQQGNEGASQMGPALAHDYKLVAKAIDNSDPHKEFSLDDANSAKLSGTRAILSDAAMAKSLRDYAKEGLEDLNRTESALDKMSAVTNTRATNFGSVDSGISGTSQKLSGSEAASRKISSPAMGVAKGPAGSAVGGPSSITGLDDKDLATGSTDKLNAPGGIAGASGGRGVQAFAGSTNQAGGGQGAAGTQSGRTPSLRELLAKRLRSGGASGASGEGEEGGAESGAKIADPAILENATFERKLIAKKEDGGAEGAKSEFLMKGSEDDAIIHKMVADWDEGRRPASGSAELEGGLLPMESRSLFERVHQAHHACMRRSCL